MSEEIQLPPEDEFECANCLRNVKADDDHPCVCHYEHFCSGYCELAWHRRSAEQLGATPEERLVGLVYRAKVNFGLGTDHHQRLVELYLRAAFELGQKKAMQEELVRAEERLTRKKTEGWVDPEEMK